MAVHERARAELTQLETGLDALELAGAQPRRRLARLWSATWPKLAAISLALLAWQLVVWSHWKPDYVLPGPRSVLERLWNDLVHGDLLDSVAITMRRAVQGFGIALVVGVVLGTAVARVKVLRAAFGSLITGLQTMPSIAWLPLAILLFRQTETAILFVVVLGATPSIANGLIAGIDNTPPLLLRAGRVLGARGLSSLRHVVLPAALPSFMAGLKQGWAFAWRSLLAGELLVIVGHVQSLGVRLQFNRENLDAEGLLATMLAILVIGIMVDSFVFGTLERAIRRRWGLVDQAVT
jgi:NitT/TauT family transport system permease protein